MPSPAASRGRDVRQRLLTAAAELIPERGRAAVSTRVLADRAGVTPSVVHYHFPSLPALLNAAVVDLIRQVLAELEAVLDSVRTPGEAVEAMLSSAEQYTGADPASLLSVESCLAATRDPQLREQIAGLVDGFGQRFGRWLGERGVDAPEETAGVLVAAVDGLVLHRALGTAPEFGAVATVLSRLVSEHQEPAPRQEARPCRS